jgi:hypothetical protein
MIPCRVYATHGAHRIVPDAAVGGWMIRAAIE